MKRAVIITSITVPVLLIAFLISIPLVNDHSAAAVEERLAEIPLPENTEYIESVSVAGKLTGNGNGMQYFGAMLIKSGLSLEELDYYYASYRESEWDLVVEKQEGQTIEVIEHGTLSFACDMGPEEGYYIVSSWGSGNEVFAMLDIRGH